MKDPAALLGALIVGAMLVGGALLLRRQPGALPAPEPGKPSQPVPPPPVGRPTPAPGVSYSPLVGGSAPRCVYQVVTPGTTIPLPIAWVQQPMASAAVIGSPLAAFEGALVTWLHSAYPNAVVTLTCQSTGESHVIAHW